MISVIIATKNGEKHVLHAIQSALSQSVAQENLVDRTKYPGFEIVVVSDGSTDKTAEVVRKASEKDSRIKLVELTTNVGPGLARGKGIDSTNPDNQYVAILDDDDEWINPDKLKNQITFLEAHTNVLVVGAQKTEFISESGKHILWYYNNTNPAYLRQNILAQNPIVNSSSVYRKDAYKKVGGYTDLRLSEDYDLWLRLGLMGDIANIEGAETRYTLRKSSMSGSNGAQARKMAQIVLRQIRQYKDKYPNYWIAALKGYARLILLSTIGVTFLASVYANLKLILGIKPKTS